MLEHDNLQPYNDPSFQPQKSYCLTKPSKSGPYRLSGYINVLILTLFLTALEDPSWNLYNALNFFLISTTTGDADKVSH